jgi:FAD/FMN-containing dehydrogenase
MSKVAHYLQEHLVGEVMYSTDARRYFATDASIIQMAPSLVVYPRNENDVRKTARFTWQLAERGRVIPITARGAGTDLTGAAIGNGIVVIFPAHMNRVLELDTKANTVTVEPGINFAKLQQTLHTHGRFVPPYPASIEYSTIGGAIGNNSSGEKTIKYGTMRNYVKGLRVVLANGEVIETGRLGKRELSKKLGLSTFEGEIYRSLDTLLEEQRQLVELTARPVVKNNAGYDLLDIRRKDGSFDLTPLFVGSQGTLGIVTEAVLGTEEHNPHTTLMLATFDSLEQLQEAVLALSDSNEPPSSIEVIDGYLLEAVNKLNPNLLKDVIASPYPAMALLVEFDNSERNIKRLRKKAQKIFDNTALNLQTADDPEDQQLLWKLRQASSTLISHNEGEKRAAPVVPDVAVPLEQMRIFIDAAYKLFEAIGVTPALWGHAGDGIFHAQPRFNIAQVGDRQKAFRLMDEFYKLALKLGGTVSSENGDGRLRSPYLPSMYAPEVYDLLVKVKQIFDPYGTLSPGVKFGTTMEDVKSMLRNDYGLDHLYDHLPRS